MIAAQTAPTEEAEPEQTAPEEPKVDLPRLRRLFEQWRDLTADARTDSLKDDDYYHGHQFTTEEISELDKRGQPVIVINRTRAAVNGILGVVERGRSDPRALPRGPEDEDTADVATDVLRYIGDKNRFHKLKIRAFRDMLVPGTAAAIVSVDADLNVVIQRIRFEEFFYDPRSREEDYTDARYMGIAKWMYADDVAALYPDKKDEITSTMDGSSLMDDGLRDRPEGQSWLDRRERRLLVVEMYHRDDGWKRCVFYQQGVLAYSESPYQDDKGKPVNPIEAMSAYIDRHNNRSGVVRDMRGPQDEINKRRSKLLHLINTSQIQQVENYGSPVDQETARAEAAKPDGIIPPGWQKVPTTDHAAGQAQLLQEAKNEIERLGPNPAVVGRDSAGASGRALQARTQAGMIELAILFGALEDWELRIWRQCWARAKQFWRAEQWIRVTDDEDAPKYVGLNQPKGPPVPKIDPQSGQQAVDEETGEPQDDEGPLDLLPKGPDGQTIPIFGYKNVVAEMDVDIIMDSTPDTGNLQAETFADLSQLVASNPAYAQSVPFKVMLELSPVPHKRRIIKMLDDAGQENQQAQQQRAGIQAQAMQAQAAAAGQEAQAKTADMVSKADLNSAKADHQRLETALTAHVAHVAHVAVPFMPHAMPPAPQPIAPPDAELPPQLATVGTGLPAAGE